MCKFCLGIFTEVYSLFHILFSCIDQSLYTGVSSSLPFPLINFFPGFVTCTGYLFNICFTALYSAEQLLQIEAYTCAIAREEDPFNEWRWVLPYPNPCKCSRVIMDGLNTWTPRRPFVPVYAKNPLLSDDISVIRDHYKLQCDEKSKYWKGNPKTFESIRRLNPHLTKEGLYVTPVNLKSKHMRYDYLVPWYSF